MRFSTANRDASRLIFWPSSIMKVIWVAPVMASNEWDEEFFLFLNPSNTILLMVLHMEVRHKCANLH